MGIAWNLPRSRRYPCGVPEQQKKKTLSLFSLYVCRLILIPCFNCVCWCRPLVWESIMQSVILSAQRVFSTTILSVVFSPFENNHAKDVKEKVVIRERCVYHCSHIYKRGEGTIALRKLRL